MMTRYTPGPWLADLETYPVMVRSQTETWPLVDEIGNEEGRAGAFVCNTGDNKANARLIAAAPDLVEALKMAVSALERSDYIKMDGDSVDVVDNAREAINKATGE